MCQPTADLQAGRKMRATWVGASFDRRAVSLGRDGPPPRSIRARCLVRELALNQPRETPLPGFPETDQIRIPDLRHQMHGRSVRNDGKSGAGGGGRGKHRSEGHRRRVAESNSSAIWPAPFEGALKTAWEIRPGPLASHPAKGLPRDLRPLPSIPTKRHKHQRSSRL